MSVFKFVLKYLQRNMTIYENVQTKSNSFPFICNFVCSNYEHKTCFSNHYQSL